MRLAIIGLGVRLSCLLDSNFRPACPDLKVVGLLDPNKSALARLTPGERRSVRICKSVKELLAKTKPDAVAIGTRCNLHTPYAIEVMAEGFPLFMEKPVAISLEQARQLERAWEKTNSRVVVSFPLRMSPICRRVKEKLAGGAVGTPQHFTAVNYVPYGNVYFDSWYRDYRVTQGLLLQKATHDFDYLSYLAEAPITRVATMLSRGRVYRDASQRNGSKPEAAHYREGIGTPETGMNEDSSNVLLEFANGIQAVYTQVFYTKRDAAARGATISGRDGTLSFDWYQSRIKLVRHHEPFTEVTTADANLNHFGGDEPLVRNFIDVVTKGSESLCPLKAGLRSVYACLAARTSAEEGRFVEVPQLGALPVSHRNGNGQSNGAPPHPQRTKREAPNGSLAKAGRKKARVSS